MGDPRDATANQAARTDRIRGTFKAGPTVHAPSTHPRCEARHCHPVTGVSHATKRPNHSAPSNIVCPSTSAPSA